MKNSVLISVILSAILLCACSPKVLTSGLRASKSPDEKLLYNMQIDYHKQHFSGLLLAKAAADSTHRMVFNSHFGMGIFDFNVGDTAFRVNSCIEPLQRKMVLKLLEQDLRTVRRNDFPETISIKHRVIGLLITLERIKNN